MIYQARSILLIDTSPFGRSLALLPVVRKLRAAYPDSLIAAAASTGAVELLAPLRLLDEAIDLGVIRKRDRGYGSALKRFHRLFKAARRSPFDLVLDFSTGLESQLLTRLAVRARTITPSKLTGVVDLLFSLGKPARAVTGALSDYTNVLRQLKIDASDMRLGLELPESENALFEKALARHGSRGGEPIVVLHTAEAGAADGWPVASFAELGSRLTNNFGARVVAADEPSDDSFTDAIGPLLPKGAIKLAEPRALELAAAVARASILVTDDQAISALALDLGTPVLEVAAKGGYSAAAKSGLSDSRAAHRVVVGSSRGRVTTDEVFETASEMLQDNRTVSLFHR
jgi:ADP-heptose:LPS heptosyltransferase